MLENPKYACIQLYFILLLTYLKLSIELAQALNGEIINADSMQVYAGAAQITNKHPIQERAGIPHHLLGHLPWDVQDYTVKEFEKEALKVIDDIHSRGKLPILVGGTHYYNQAIMFKNSTVDDTISKSKENTEGNNKRLKKELSKDQISILDGPSNEVFKKLMEVDADVASKFHPNDTRRIRRALEIYYLTGQKPSSIYQQQISEGSDQLSLRFNTLVFWVWCEQLVLNTRLDVRVDNMLKNGLYSEIEELYAAYKVQKSQTNESEVRLKGIWQVIGFKEFLPWLEGDRLNSKLLDDCIDKMKQQTRKYSKQQTKFMKNMLMPKLSSLSSTIPEYSAAILDATDLNKWSSSVGETGLNIAREFLDSLPDESQKDNSVTKKRFFADTPELLELMVQPKKFTKDQWKHFTCEVCVDASTGEKFVAIGKDRWDVHLKSRKHKSTVAGKARHEFNMAQIAMKKKRLEEDSKVQPDS